MAAGRRWNDSKPPTSIESFVKKDSKVEDIDAFSAMLGEDGNPLPDIFVKDNMHMNPKSYALWTPIVRAYLESRKISTARE